MKKVLVVEDEAQTRALFLKCLEAEGFLAIGAENGLIGIQQAREQLPDLVICDIVMPKLDGYGVLTRLRQDPTTAIIAFIFLTASHTKAEIRKGMELGADDYLTKPATAEELLNAIAVQLKKQTMLRHYYASQPATPLPSEVATISAAPASIFPAVPRLDEIFEFIEANYHHQISLSDVAQATGYTASYLTNLVRRQTGRTVLSWIVERRMVEVRALLQHSDRSVDQIARNVGYENARPFFRQFRQYHGTTPQAWRKAHQTLANVL